LLVKVLSNGDFIAAFSVRDGKTIRDFDLKKGELKLRKL
jgi:hypothetical protein